MHKVHLFQITFWLICYSATKSCVILCDPMECSTPGPSVLHYLLECAQTHICWVDGAWWLQYFAIDTLFCVIKNIGDATFIERWNFSLNDFSPSNSWVARRSLFSFRLSSKLTLDFPDNNFQECCRTESRVTQEKVMLTEES